MTTSSKGKTCAAGLERALSIAPAELVRKLQSLLSDSSPAGQPSGAWKRKVHDILQPSQQCYEPLAVTSLDGGQIFFSCAVLSRMLEYVTSACEWYRQRLQAISISKIGLLIFGDETTGGNVLATSSSKKMWLFHVAFPQLGELHRPDSWLPLAAIPHRDVVQVQGGLSKCVAVILASLQRQLRTAVCIHGYVCRFYLHAFLGDYDGLIKCYCAKGASATKPCLLCQNCLSKEHIAAWSDDYFQTISSAELERFQPTRSDELWSLYDALLLELPNMTKARQKEAEKFLGFTLDPDSLLACRNVREMIPLTLCMLDACHCYYSKGLAASEIVLAWQSLSQKIGLQLAHLQQSMVDIAWQCKDRRLSSKSAKRFLFHASLWDGMHKGSASDVYSLLPWLWFHFKNLAGDKDLPELLSFEALMEVHMELRAFRAGSGSSAKLDQCQRRHQRLFCNCYPGQERPKGHLRLHLPDIYCRLGYADCFPGEAKHRLYKSFLADSHAGLWQQGTGKLSAHLCGRLLLKTSQQLQESPWTHRMKAPIHDAQKTGLEDCLVSREYHLGSLLLGPDMPLVWQDGAGVVQFFVEYHSQHYVIVEKIQELPASVRFSRKFAQTGVKEAVRLIDIKAELPTWWLFEESTVLMLL